MPRGIHPREYFVLPRFAAYYFFSFYKSSCSRAVRTDCPHGTTAYAGEGTPSLGITEATMTVLTVRDRFLDFLTIAGLNLDSLTPAIGLERMLEFYAHHRVDHCQIDEDGDMLLYQWGLYDWGEGEHFEWNITRQLLTAAGDGDEEIAQLSLTFRFEAEPSWDALGDGEMWCDEPGDVEHFRTAVMKSKPYGAACASRPVAVTLTLEDV